MNIFTNILSRLNFLNKPLARVQRFLLQIDKRVRFVVGALGLTFLMLFTTFLTFDNAWFVIPILVLVTYAATYFSILEGVEKIEWTMLFIMPVMLTVGFYVFYFLFPVRWLTRVPFMAIYAISMYAAFLTSNIFNVGVEKNLQLYRAAFSVNYFYQTVVLFLSLNVLFSLRENFVVNAVGVGLITLPLAFQMLWSIRLKLELIDEVRVYGLALTFIMAQLALVLSFVPFETSILSLILTACYYSFIGIIYSHLDQRLFKETVRGYLFVMVFVFAIALLTLQW